MSRSTAVLITFLMMIGLAILASSCTQSEWTGVENYKGHIIGQSVKHIVTDKPGYVVGDTIIIQIGYNYTNLVIESIIK